MDRQDISRNIAVRRAGAVAVGIVVIGQHRHRRGGQRGQTIIEVIGAGGGKGQ